jgi:para-aminobenzoate synthetase component 1
VSELHKVVQLMNAYGKKAVPFLFIIDYEMKEPLVYELDSLNLTEIFYSIDRFQNLTGIDCKQKELLFYKEPIDKEKYAKAFLKVQQNIKAGNTYLLNLTFPTRIEMNLSFEEIFELSNAPYKLLYKNQFVVFSPETFVKIYDGKIFSYPMKGTIDADIENAAEIILNDTKEIAEHITIVDLIRNDLSVVSKNVTVDRFRYIEEIKTHEKTLLQVSSQISGTLPKNYSENLGDIIFNLLPAGSISGAPKKKTFEIIKEVEIAPRNYYTGIFGIFDGKNLDSAVMIRFIENIDGQYYFKSGGGITYQSDMEMEYQELVDKVYVPINRSN